MTYKLISLAFTSAILLSGCNSNKEARPSNPELPNEKAVIFKEDFEKTLREMIYFQKKVSFELKNTQVGVKKIPKNILRDEEQARYKETIMYKSIKNHFED